jgi:hypothetical protein
MRVPEVPVLGALSMTRTTIGAGLLSRFGTVRITWADRGRSSREARLEVDSSRESLAGPGWERVDMERLRLTDGEPPPARFRANVPIIRCSLNGRPLLAALDTGTSADIILFGPSHPEEPGRRVPIAGFGRSGQIIRAARAAELMIGGRAFSVHPATLDPPLAGAPVDAAIGLGVLTHQEIVLDYDRATVLLGPPSARHDPASPPSSPMPRFEPPPNP